MENARWVMPGKIEFMNSTARRGAPPAGRRGRKTKTQKNVPDKIYLSAFESYVIWHADGHFEIGRLKEAVGAMGVWSRRRCCFISRRLQAERGILIISQFADPVTHQANFPPRIISGRF
jgi:hypothetical protein